MKQLPMQSHSVYPSRFLDDSSRDHFDLRGPEQTTQIGQASKATADITANVFTSRANILLPRTTSKQAAQMSASEQSPNWSASTDPAVVFYLATRKLCDTTKHPLVRVSLACKIRSQWGNHSEEQLYTTLVILSSNPLKDQFMHFRPSLPILANFDHHKAPAISPGAF